jgi:hypothetical protein
MAPGYGGQAGPAGPRIGVRGQAGPLPAETIEGLRRTSPADADAVERLMALGSFTFEHVLQVYLGVGRDEVTARFFLVGPQ